jgi:hypothetical protein
MSVDDVSLLNCTYSFLAVEKDIRVHDLILCTRSPPHQVVSLPYTPHRL